MDRCSGFRSHKVQCSGSAVTGTYCWKHQYQADPKNICKGLTAKKVPCCAEVKNGRSYCQEQHKPTLVQHVHPTELRIEWNLSTWAQRRDEVVEEFGRRDAYTTLHLDTLKGTHLEHPFEHQLTADSLNGAVVARFDHGQTEDQKGDLVRLLRGDIVNRTKYLRITSAKVNLLKGDACAKLIDPRRAGDNSMTFTTCMDNAYRSEYPGQRLGRTESKNIRETMLKVAKQLVNDVEDEADDNKLTKAFVKELKEYRVALNK